MALQNHTCFADALCNSSDGGSRVDYPVRVDITWPLAIVVDRSSGFDVALALGSARLHLLNDVLGWAEFMIFVGAFVAAMGGVGLLAYAVHRANGLTRTTRRFAILGLGVLFALSPFVVLPLAPRRTKFLSFGLSELATAGFFRLVELAFSTGPHGFDTGLRNWVLYFVTPSEIAFDDCGRPKAAPAGEAKACLRSLAGHALLLSALCSVGEATAFVPLLPASADPAAMSWLGWPRSLPAVWLQAWCFYALLMVQFQFWRSVAAALGFATVPAFDQPLTRSTSPRDFWGRRWNLFIHRMMHRSFFAPCARTVGPRVGALAAFAASGLFHEYMWLVMNWGEAWYVPGGTMIFFASQFVLCVAQALLSRTTVGRMCTSMPGQVRLLLTMCIALPLGPLFFQGLHRGGLLTAVAHMLPRVSWAA